MPDFALRRAHTRDAKGVTECIDAAYSIYVGRVQDLPAVSAGIAHAIENHRVWVAEIDRRIVGAMVLVPHYGFAVLENIAVRPECTGLGLGRVLIEQAEEDSRGLGLPEIRLSTHKDMLRNVAIYSRLGWKETGRSGNKVNMSKQI